MIGKLIDSLFLALILPFIVVALLWPLPKLLLGWP
jgi:hypothetical protein